MDDTLFAYGSLRVDDIMCEVAGTRYVSQSAIAKGYMCYQVKNATYPGLIKKEGAETPGCIYRGLTETSWKRLDSFEGTLYIRQPITVITEKDLSVSAQTYIIHPDKHHYLTSTIWDYDHFLTHGLDTFMKRNFGGQTPRPPERG